jgi:excisionase family DNA binding protein
VVDPILLTVEEAAETLKCSRSRIFELLADGTLVRGRKHGRKTVIIAESVFAACEADYHPPASKPRRSSRADRDAELDAWLEDVRAS